VQVADSGSPPLTATQSFYVAVAALAKPQLGPVTLTNSLLQMQVSGSSGPDYIIQVSTNLSAPNSWFSIFTNYSPTVPFFWSDFIATNFPVRFYRVQLSP
jgi:hypothetical protein